MGKFWILLLCVMFASCATDLDVRKKIRGVSYVAVRDTIGPEEVKPLQALNADHASVMPYGFLRDSGSSEVIYNTPRQWFGEREEGVRQYIRELHKMNIRVMVKPHLWIGRGFFTGDLTMENEQDWKHLQDSYRSYILFYAKLAEEEGAELFCIGTELHSFAIERPEFFRDLIREVRKVFSGELTYAENWDQYQNISFWGELDLIGVDAYFPLTASKTPEVDELLEEWERHKDALEACALKYEKPILFAEYGYRSTDYNTKAPWDSSRKEVSVNLQAQVNALRAMAEVIWEEDWFAGGFLWKWFPFHQKAGGKDDNRFTIQNKPAEALIREVYKIQK
ncbi:glycoside hydrolase [Robertkochia marina]|uniref:Glycoside hydrolase n=1 Tax=Robertkochia marina TaxID=1227945 RepID=A0A4V3UYI2_9FLAO|nr:glycoside hydrolase [Robertkochia marina]THD69788.1 glycoside hydrolase [Robertkochia marina]TRZ46868.1 glycoside hydrolase [Robertkochia marina]